MVNLISRKDFVKAVSLVPQEHMTRQSAELFNAHDLVILIDIAEEVLVPRKLGQRRTVEFFEDSPFFSSLGGNRWNGGWSRKKASTRQCLLFAKRLWRVGVLTLAED